MSGLIRTRLLQRVFGGGTVGVVGAALASRALDRLRDELRGEPELLDVSTLVPGETYTVVTRPAPDRTERKLAKRARKVNRKLEAERRPSRKLRRVEKDLRIATRKVQKAKVASRKERRWAARAAEARQRRDALAVPSKRQQRLERKAAALEAELAARRAAAVEKTRKRRRVIRRRFT